MTDQERKDFIKTIESYKGKLSKSEEKAKKFLVDVGLYTEKGNLRKHYKHLCIQQDPA